MRRINAIWLLLLLVLLALVAGACSSSEPGSLDESLALGENFVKNSPTYNFDGIPETFKLSDTVPMGDRI